MRKPLLFAFLLVSTFCFGQGRFTKSYSGNGKSSFGGAIGQGTVAITDTPDSLIFSLTKGPGRFDSVLVFYLDAPISNPFITHISSTSQLPGSSDPYKAAVAGLNTNVGQSAVLNFPSDFQPDVAIALDNTAGRLYAFSALLGGIVEQTSFTVTPSGDPNAPVYTVGVKKSDLSITGNPSFTFIATYIGPNASRSNEAFGPDFASYPTSRVAAYATYNMPAGSFLTFASTLPVKLVDFKASKERDGVSVSWSVAQESNIDAYEVQRSADGVQFSTIQTVKARNASASSSYNAKDNAPFAAGSYYRLAIRENGKLSYSKVVYIGGNAARAGFAANYQGGNVLTLSLNGIAADNYNLSVVNGAGQVVKSQSLQHDGATTSRQLYLNTNLATGIYRVVLQSAKEKFVTAVLVQ